MVHICCVKHEKGRENLVKERAPRKKGPEIKRRHARETGAG